MKRRQSTRKTGNNWEEHAADYLRERGLQIIARGFSCRFGEIDLIARDHDTLAFVEIRFRTKQGFATAAETVDGHKQSRIVHAARFFIMQHPDIAQTAMRFDVVAIDEIAADKQSIEWIQNAFHGA